MVTATKKSQPLKHCLIGILYHGWLFQLKIIKMLIKCMIDVCFIFFFIKNNMYRLG